MEFFDTHAHYMDERFDEDRAALLTALPQYGVAAVLECACTEAQWPAATALAEAYDHIWCALGVHGQNAHEATPGWQERLGQALRHPRAVAIGEIGLDYYYDFAPRELQREVFAAQLALAVELDLPVVIHDREAHKDVFDAVAKHQGRLRGVLHCYSGSAEMVREYLPLGLYFGVGGSLTFQNNEKGRRAAEAMPMDRILLETDSPYLAPVPKRGKRNDSTKLLYINQKLAEVKGVAPDAMAAAALENGKKLFGIE